MSDCQIKECTRPDTYEDYLSSFLEAEDDIEGKPSESFRWRKKYREEKVGEALDRLGILGEASKAMSNIQFETNFSRLSLTDRSSTNHFDDIDKRLSSVKSRERFAPDNIREVGTNAADFVAQLAYKAMNLIIPAVHASEDTARCTRPDYSLAAEKYELVSDLDDLIRTAGGFLEKNYASGGFFNGCSSRISFVVEQTGCPIPRIPGQTVSGSNGEQYIYRLRSLVPFLEKAYGPPDCEWRYGKLTKNSKPELCQDPTAKGIVVEVFKPRLTTTAYGHAFIGSPDDDESYTGKYLDVVMLWILPSNEKEKNL